MKRDDALWKGLLEDIFDDFLRFHFPNADDLFDMSRPFEFLDKELEQLFPADENDFSPKYVDKLVKVITKEGLEGWILVHIEVQGSRDRDFAERMFTYYHRIKDKYNKPITAFAILTDKNKSFRPTAFVQEFLGTKINYEFNSYKVLDADTELLQQSNNPFAIAILTVQTALLKGTFDEEKLFDLKTDLAKHLLSKAISKEKIRSLMRFLKLYIRFDNERYILKFENTLNQLANRQTTMGLEEFVLDRAKRQGLYEGRKEGIKEGLKEGMEIARLEKERAFVTNLLKKTSLDILQIADIAGVTITFVEEIKATLTA
ncbi:hypothetical protein GVN20_28565 [Runella sp. CRIBMP]|uniref:hypothetical protein n=1 Tax=Runella sp. CRIBMP TaxID=2683261 RepID=UPI0014128103|nr:hypothetical protein [Runella sp. CRIBMP]NBB23338.1 hypothetical protein [Runella sp. CRIBMP]